MSRYPFPRNPNGWFQLAYSDEIPAGAVQRLQYFGQELVAFRGEDGRVHVLDAYCPHLGANLAIGGKVEGDTIRCPFHGWRFDGEGQCVEIPYAKRIPPKARAGAWPAIERNGMVLVWHHAEKQPPQWDVPEIPEVGHPDWTDLVRLRWRLRTHNQEMAENAVDRAHFLFVHGTLEVPSCEAEAEGHVLRMVQRSKMATPRGPIDGQIAATNYGFGYGTTRFTGIVETLLVSSVVPIDDDDVDVRFSFTVKKIGNADVTRGVGKALIADIKKQMGEDKPIWENKRFLPRPLLCDGDGPIPLFRKWCLQFYTWPDGTTGETAGASAAAAR
jgi:phenylpropionate dioxygenase-like ring-hydroxylating dioxygenase large terminal subunit